MTQETVLIMILAAASLMIWWLRMPERILRNLRLKPLAIAVLLAAALSSTPDILTCLLLTGFLFAAYLIAELVLKRIKGTVA